MKTFRCTCGQPLFFENTRCEQCLKPIGYDPDSAELRPYEAAILCRNSLEYQACNWIVTPSDGQAYCRACRLNDVVPDLTVAEHLAPWRRLEAAKRRLLFTLFSLGLPERGLSFRFLDAAPGGEAPVVTGHQNGMITIALAEAEDAERERTRDKLGEAYRTLLGHFRHESGHLYFDRLIAGGPRLEEFRALFGDERADYDEARTRHYQEPAAAGWQDRFVSAYAGMHPWEDWAESWAHYLHMVDTLETAKDFRLTMHHDALGDSEPEKAPDPLRGADFERLIRDWIPLTFAFNNLARSMGVRDPYPFVLSAPAIAKLRFVHETVHAPVPLS